MDRTRWTRTTRTTAAGPGPGVRRAWVAAGLAVLVLVTVLAAIGILPMAPRGADAAPEHFSAGRALDHLEEVADEPRVPGSPAHAEARAYLLGQLADLGWRAEVRDGVGVGDWGLPGTVPVAAVANVVATLPGTDPTGTVLLAAHYDTVPGSPGAGDDGMGVGTVLETARALTAGGDRPRNDLMVLLTDAEELGLLGAEAFTADWPGDAGTTVVLNHEARGAGGAPQAFRSTSPNGRLLAALAAAPGASAESVTEAIFAALPNDTDFRHFEDAGMHGLDTAVTGGGALYHSPLDDVAHLSPASLQQMGETSLALARDLAATDLQALDDGGEGLVTTLPWGLLRYPAALEVPLAAAALALALVAVAVRRARRELTVPRTVLGAVLGAVALGAAGLTGHAVWWVAVRVDPGQASAFVGEPYRSWPYQVAIVLGAVGAVLAVYTLARRTGPAAVAAGSLTLLAAAGVALAVALPGISAVLVLPVLPAALGAAAAAALPERRAGVRAVVLWLSLVPVAVLLGPGVVMNFDLGLGLGAAPTAVVLAVAVLLALPLVETGWPRAGRRERPGWRVAIVPAVVLALVAAGTVTGLLLNRAGAAGPRQVMAGYALDADAGAATWTSWAPPRTPWARSVLTEDPAALDALPWTNGYPVSHGPAPATDLAPPAADVVADVVRGDARELTLRLRSPRGAATLGLWVEAGSATVREAYVAGRQLPVRQAWGRWNFGLLFHGAPAEGVEVRLVLEQHAPEVAVLIADRTHDAADMPLEAPPGTVLVTPEVSVATAARF